MTQSKPIAALSVRLSGSTLAWVSKTHNVALAALSGALRLFEKQSKEF